LRILINEGPHKALYRTENDLQVVLYLKRRIVPEIFVKYTIVSLVAFIVTQN